MAGRGRVVGFLFHRVLPFFPLLGTFQVSIPSGSSLFHSFVPSPFAIKFTADTSHTKGAQTMTGILICGSIPSTHYLRRHLAQRPLHPSRNHANAKCLGHQPRAGHLWQRHSPLQPSRRYLDNDGKIGPAPAGTKEESHVSFGFGRRVCPGRFIVNKMLLINMALFAWSAKIDGWQGEDGNFTGLDVDGCIDEGIVV